MIQRYGIMSNSHDSWFVPSEDGDYVSFNDYEQLRRANALLLDALEESEDEIGNAYTLGRVREAIAAAKELLK